MTYVGVHEAQRSDSEARVRKAQPSDGTAIREVARRSLRTSYSFSPNTIDSVVQQWYGENAFAEHIRQLDVLIQVAEIDGEVVGYSDVSLSDNTSGTIRWLHIAPAYRGRGIGSLLLTRVRENLEERDIDTLFGTVLAQNREGNTFYEDNGFEKKGTDKMAIDGRTYVENVYIDASEEVQRPDSETVTLSDGRPGYVNPADVEPGSEAPFQIVYTDSAQETQYGYYCKNCETLANAMDAMGRIACPSCDNIRRPTRWDSVYL